MRMANSAEAVKRNSTRFPNDFMLRLTAEETVRLRSQFVTSNVGRGGSDTPPRLGSPGGSDRPPTRLVVGPALLLGEKVARLQVREEVDQTHLAPRALDLADRATHRRLVRRSVGEEAPELRLGLEQPGALWARFGKHCVHELLHLRGLIRRELEAVPELEDVHPAGVAVLVGRERQAEAATLAHHLLELRRARLGDLVPISTHAPLAVLGPRDRRGRGEHDRHTRPENHSPHARSSSGPSVNSAAGARRSAEARQILRERRALARAQRDRDAELLEVLRERLAAEVDLPRADEGVDVALELGRGERDDALGQAPERVLRVLALHRLPVGLDEVPRQLARMDAREERANDERRVLCPDLAVERARERLPDQRGLAEAGEGVEVALLLLGGRGGAKAAEKLVVACPVARVRQDRDERGEDVRVHVIAARDVGRVALGGLALDCRIVAEGAESAREGAPRLPRQLVLARGRGPAEKGEGRRHAIADERRQAS